jgi:hypothetical protein
MKSGTFPPDRLNEAAEPESVVEVMVSAVVAQQTLRAAGAARGGDQVLAGLIDGYCANAPNAAGARAPYLLSGALRLHAIGESFGEGNPVAATLRSVAATISARAFGISSAAPSKLTAIRTLLHRIFRQVMKRPEDRNAMAKSVIDELRSKRLVTPSEATNLKELLMMIFIARGVDAALAKEIDAKARRFLAHKPSALAREIATMTVHAAQVGAAYSASGRSGHHS